MDKLPRYTQTSRHPWPLNVQGREHARLFVARLLEDLTEWEGEHVKTVQVMGLDDAGRYVASSRIIIHGKIDGSPRLRAYSSGAPYTYADPGDEQDTAERLISAAAGEGATHIEVIHTY